jgi:hypothetical protein
MKSPRWRTTFKVVPDKNRVRFREAYPDLGYFNVAKVSSITCEGMAQSLEILQVPVYKNVQEPRQWNCITTGRE